MSRRPKATGRGASDRGLWGGARASAGEGDLPVAGPLETLRSVHLRERAGGGRLHATPILDRFDGAVSAMPLSPANRKQYSAMRNISGSGGEGLMASKSARVYAAIVAALLICALTASAASAQSPPTIRAVDTPSQAWTPQTTTVPTGSTV